MISQYERQEDEATELADREHERRSGIDAVGNITDVEFEGIDTRDAPDFCDAYISYAVWADTGRELTDLQIDQINDNHPDYIHELLMDYLY